MWTLIFILSASFTQPLVADEWHLVRDTEGVQVYSKTTTDSKFSAFKGTTLVAASLASVLGVLDNIADCDSWLYQCTEGALLHRDGLTTRMIYQVIDLPFPASNRDLVSVVHLSWDKPTSTFLIEQSAVPDLHPRTANIRVIRSRGQFALQPLDEGTTRVTWEFLVDPAGFLPAFIVNRMAVELPFQSLKQLRIRATQPPYDDLELLWDDNGVPGGLKEISW